MSREHGFEEKAKLLYGLEHHIRGDTIILDEEGYLAIKIGNRIIRVVDLMNNYKLEVAYIRIMPLIERSMRIVHEAFEKISKAVGFKGYLKPLYPMKVNPTPIVVEAIFKYGAALNWGFNAGSLGEVKLLKSMTGRYGPRTLIYDGVITDHVAEELVELYKSGWYVVADVESEHDAEILEKYPEIRIGLRIKPIVKMHGKWSGSVGLGSKFGMTTNAVSKLLSDYKWLVERAELLHMHPGSQVYKLEDLKRFFEEIKHVFRELRSLGLERLKIVDPGGGMAYPYLDTRDGTEESPDYTIMDYFRELLSTFANAEYHPDVVFEGGRFIVAGHRLVVSKVVDVRPYSAVEGPTSIGERALDVVDSVEDAERLISEVKQMISKLRKSSTLDNSKRELYEDLVKLVREDLVYRLSELIESGALDPGELVKHAGILKILVSPSKRYILNMSIFADIPDAVLVDQYFQVVPAQRLNEPPDVLATLSDLTCDSMGEITVFISHGEGYHGKYLFTRLDRRLVMAPGVKLKLRGAPLHLPNKGENYYVVFLDTGAYQDTLAMRHNMIYGAPEIILDFDDSGEIVVKLLMHENLYT